MTFELHHISHSAANKYLTCGERYRLERVEHHYGLPHLAAIGGSAFHSCTEEYDLMTEYGQGFAVPSFQTFFDASLEEALEKHYSRTGEELTIDGIPHSKGEDYEWWLTKGPEMVQKYLDWRETTGWILETVEYGYEQELGLSVPAVGYIDREFFIPGKFGNGNECKRILIDIKTGKKIWQSPQLLEYAVIRRLQGVNIDLVAYYDARKGVITEPVDPTTHTVAWLKNYYGTVVDKIKAGIFVANPGVQCRYCPVREICTYREVR